MIYFPLHVTCPSCFVSTALGRVLPHHRRAGQRRVRRPLGRSVEESQELHRPWWPYEWRGRWFRSDRLVRFSILYFLEFHDWWTRVKNPPTMPSLGGTEVVSFFFKFILPCNAKCFSERWLQLFASTWCIHDSKGIYAILKFRFSPVKLLLSTRFSPRRHRRGGGRVMHPHPVSSFWNGRQSAGGGGGGSQ